VELAAHSLGPLAGFWHRVNEREPVRSVSAVQSLFGPLTRTGDDSNPDRGFDYGRLGSPVMSDQVPPLGTPAEVATYLHTTTAALAQDRYKGTGPKFIKRGAVPVV
jgi:hypothetical protein